MATCICMKKETLVVKRLALRVANSELKQEKVHSALELIKEQRKKAPRLPI